MVTNKKTSVDNENSNNNSNQNEPSSSNLNKSNKICNTPACTNPASLQCPTCIQLKLNPSLYCSQECFKKSFKTHNQIHKIEKGRREFVIPPFDYRGSLRPNYVTPFNTVPDSVSKPDYYLTGIPSAEDFLRSKGNIPIYGPSEIEKIRKACLIGREALDLAHSIIKPGITTDFIDLTLHNFIVSKGAYPSPLNYRSYPKSICTSVNEIICHGIPDVRSLEEGDIVNIDVSVYFEGFHGDLNETFPVGKVDPESLRLIKSTYDAMMDSIKITKPGTMCRDYGEVIARSVKKSGFSIVRSYCGHGVGVHLHCRPDIPHYPKNKAIGTMKEGMVFTVEPMINMGDWRDITWPDDWSSSTVDGKRSAQFEHTVLVTKDGFEILTARTSSSPKFFWESEGSASAAESADQMRNSSSRD